MTAYIICSNDSIEGVVIDDVRRARIIMSELSRHDYMKYKRGRKTRKAYRARANWHIHEVKITE